MQDLPSHELFQQRHARPINGEDLEVLGKRASADWSEGKYDSLTEAVVETVKHAGLSPEQVRRVVEFTNTDAFLREFRKEGSSKYVQFDNGPADPRAVLQDLNDGGGGSVFDPGDGHYKAPPPEKTASDDTALFGAFAVKEVVYPDHNPMGEVLELRDKLASARDTYTAMLRGLENDFDNLRGRVFHHVKQAALQGHSLSEIANIWERFAPDAEYVKVAFDTIIGPLLDNGVFSSGEELAASFQKHAAAATPNPQHPLVVDFQDYCQVLDKLAQVREDYDAVTVGLRELNDLLKQANEGGLVGKGVDLVQRAAGAAERGGNVVGEKLFGPGKGKALGTAAKYTTYAVPAVAAHEAYRSTVKHSPIKQKVLSAVPGTQEYNQREYDLMARSQGMY